MRCSPDNERPIVDVSGLGHGMRTVAVPMVPACSRTGRSPRYELIAYAQRQ